MKNATCWHWPNRIIYKRESAELRAEHNSLVCEIASFQPFAPKAWTGGSGPNKPSETGLAERALARALFRQQVNAFRSYWKDYPPFDTLRIFFNRARCDAHASFRNALNR